jgi:hypothetical protein
VDYKNSHRLGSPGVEVEQIHAPKGRHGNTIAL